MKTCLNKIIVINAVRRLFLVASAFLTSTSVWAANIQWSGADLVNNNTNWSDGVNWAGTPPAPADAVFFFDAGGAASAGIVDNIVDTSATVTSIKYGNTNNFHTTQINAGQTLTVTGGLTVGTETGTPVNDQIVTATVTGPGTLSVANGNIIVRQCNGSSSTIRNALLDMSGLSNFTANVTSLQMGVQLGATPGVRASGAIYLAMTNRITATTIILHQNPTSPVLGNNNILYLGQTNVIFANIITNGGDKSQFSTLMAFKPGLNSPVAYIRAADGVSRVSLWMTGDESHQVSSSNTANGTEDFSGGTVDALVSTMALGKSSSTTGGNGTGVLIVGNGTVDVNTLQVGYQTASGATSAGKGFVTVGAGQGVSQGIVKVNTLMEVGKVTGTATANSSGSVTVTNGGTLQAKSIVFGAASQANVFTIGGDNVGRGNLVVNDTAATVVGSSTVRLATMNMTNSAMRLSLNGSTATTPKIYVGALNIPNTGGSTTTINIDSIANVTTPTTFSIINFTTLSGDPTTFVVGNLPGGYNATVTSTSTEIQLQVSPQTGPGTFTSKPAMLSFALNGSNVSISGTNGQAGDAYYLLTSTNVALPLAQWTVTATNVVGSVGANGSFTFVGTNVIVPADQQQFYILSSTNSNHP